MLHSKGSRWGLLGMVFLLGIFTRAEAQTDKTEEWKKTVQAAEKEGRVVIYDNASNDRVYQEFQKRYPGIKLVSVVARGDELGPRIMTERRAKKYIGDVYIGGLTTAYGTLYQGKIADTIRPALILPEVLDESKWFDGKHQYLDREGRFIFLFEGTALSYIHYNTQLVKREEITSYWDLLNPKWKGKILSFDPMVPGLVGHGIRFMYYQPDLGPKYLARLFGEMDITISRDSRQMANWLAVGKFPLCLFCYDIPDAKKQGLPVDTLGPYSTKEGANIVPITGALVLMNQAPEPNAAKVFVNWFLSREGQLAYQRSRAANFSGADSLRVDISKEDVPPESRRRTGGNFLMLNRSEMLDVRPIRKVITDARPEAKR